MAGTRKSGLTVILFSILLGATTATADEGRSAQTAPDANNEDAREADSGVDAPEFPVPTKTRNRRPEGNPVELDSLLHLPSGFGSASRREVAGAGESEWRRRFGKADRELLEARASLNDTKRELDEVAVDGGSSQWSVAPPGGGAGGGAGAGPSPLSFKLRQKLKDDRERIDAKKRALRELRIEADLAGVPQSWRAVDAKPPESSRTRQELD